MQLMADINEPIIGIWKAIAAAIKLIDRGTDLMSNLMIRCLLIHRRIDYYDCDRYWSVYLKEPFMD